MSTYNEIALATNIITVYVGGFMYFLGTIGNLINILAFCYLKTYRNLSTSVFLTASSIAGQIYITFAIFLPFLSYILDYNPAAQSQVFCGFVTFVKAVSPQISMTCLCLSAIDRYLITNRYVRFRILFNVHRARLIICLSVLIWSCYGIPNAIYIFYIYSFNFCTTNINFLRISAYLNLFIEILLPISIMTVFGLLTWKNLGRIRQSSLSIQVAKMIILDVIVVGISNISLGGVYLYEIAINTIQLFAPTTYFIFTIAQLISATQSCASFYLYLIISSTFRKNIKIMLSKTCCFWNQTMKNRIAPQIEIVETNH